MAENNNGSQVTYYYEDEDLNIVCKRIGTNGKLLGLDDKPIKRGLVVPLYNLAMVMRSDVVYICESESTADTLSKHDLCGTTSPFNTWQEHLSSYLAGKIVVILVKNTRDSKKYYDMVRRALRANVKELRRVVHDGSLDIGSLFADSVEITKTARAQAKKATTDEYFELFESVFGNPRKCIFNQKLMHQTSQDSLWNPCINDLEIVKSHALTANESREAKFSVGAIQPHFFAYEAMKEPEFLVNIPTWDGEERIEAMAGLITLRESSGISQLALAELLKEWCSLVFQRLHDPEIQNRILVLQGGQGIGKDTWTSMLVDGLGQFSIPLAVMRDDKDTYLNLHRGLIMKISEFDKTAKTEVSTLKDIITTPSTNIRAPYDKDSRLRMSRCSFISSANIKNLLRDSTGNRRFLIFEVDHIEYAYSGWDKAKKQDWRMQCLAEMAHLADIGYTASEESWRMMREYIERETPEEFGHDIAEHFIQEYRSDISLIANSNGDIFPTDSRVREILTKLSKHHGVRVSAIRNMIQSKIGLYRRVASKRFWVWKLPDIEATEATTHDIEQDLPF